MHSVPVHHGHVHVSTNAFAPPKLLSSDDIDGDSSPSPSLDESNSSYFISAPLSPWFSSSSSSSPSSSSPIVYRTRWYICSLFVLFCIMQNSMWGFFSPIQQPLKQVYGWDDLIIEWLGNSSNITFLILVLPLGALIDSPHGMRNPLLVCVFALCINSGLRCLPVSTSVTSGLSPHTYTGLSILSMCANGVAGTLETLSPPVLSTLWFPVHERATATAIMATANTLGTAVGFSVAFIVPSSGSDSEILDRLSLVYYSMFSICVLLLVSMIVYFPARPPTPPSASCRVEKVKLKKGLKALLVNSSFWVVVFSMSIPLGVYSAWLNVLDLNLKNFDFSQSDAGWVGFASSVTGTIAGVVTGRIADKFPGRLARIIAILYTSASVCMIWFSLLCFDVLPFSLSQAFLSSILVGVCMFGSYPLFFELIVEVTFPIPEGIVSGVMVMSLSAVQAVFLALPVAQLGTDWMNYTLCTCPALGAVMLALFKEKYTRLNMDLKEADGGADAVDVDAGAREKDVATSAGFKASTSSMSQSKFEIKNETAYQALTGDQDEREANHTLNK